MPMNLNTNDVKISGNDKCEFYQNSWTKGADQWANEWGLKNLHCLLAIQKSDPNDQEYILVYKGEVVYVSKQYDAIGAHIDIIALSEGKKREDHW